ncbi:hypothetical protein ASE66_19300 [Bosea sp. Root483D1]|uniref:ribbon-helix-helix protein n=1 Tax=Bosea sp. Root483D1 TaxID=1736544 RepID=UPI000709D748|nr:hypothetical protein [Bosea sp. Root483D1]KRE12652.1 hypothetical protein ASE66_19300 [Bosea sp. Root483D1]
MSAGQRRRSFATRPATPEHWIREAEAPSSRPAEPPLFTARLTIDVTPELRGRIKVVAFQRGQTVAEMLRELLAREFPSPPGDPS